MYVKYEGPDSYRSKNMANVKVFADKLTHGQTDGQKTISPRSIDAGGGGIKTRPLHTVTNPWLQLHYISDFL